MSTLFARTIPLYGRRGNVVAVAYVDDPDFQRLGHYRWSLHTNGYARREVGRAPRRKRIYLHREILGLVKGDGKYGDHINGDRLDNRRLNLRVTDAKGNAQNVRPHRDGSSRFRGVSYRRDTEKWVAQVWTGDCVVGLGQFDSEEEAGAAAAAYRAENMSGSAEALAR